MEMGSDKVMISKVSSVMKWWSSSKLCLLLHLHLSLNCRGHWDSTDDFTTSFLHFSLFSTALLDLANSRPGSSLMWSSHFFVLSALSSSSFHCALPDCFGQIWWMGDMSMDTTSVCISQFTMVKRSLCDLIACLIIECYAYESYRLLLHYIHFQPVVDSVILMVIIQQSTSVCKWFVLTSDQSNHFKRAPLAQLLSSSWEQPPQCFSWPLLTVALSAFVKTKTTLMSSDVRQLNVLKVLCYNFMMIKPGAGIACW